MAKGDGKGDDYSTLFSDLPSAAESGTAAPGTSEYKTLFQDIPGAKADTPGDGTERYTMLGAALDAAREGATYGFDAQAEAGLGGRSVEEVKAQRKRNMKDHWLASQAGYVAGAVGSTLAPIPTPAKVGLAGRALHGLSRVANTVLPNVNIARSIGQGGARVATNTLLKEGAKAGGKTAALQGIAATDASNTDNGSIEGLTRRALEVGANTVTGAALGAPLNWAGARGGQHLSEWGGDVYSSAQHAFNNSGTPSTAGRTQAIRAMRRDGLESFDDLANATLPSRGVKPDGKGATIEIDPRAKMAALEAHGQALADGATPRDARQAAQAALRGNLPDNMNVSDDVVTKATRDIIARHNERNAIPLNMAEATAITTKSPGKNTHLAYERGVNSPSEAGNQAADWAMRRQEGLGPALENVISDVPMREYVGQHAQRLRVAKDPYPALWTAMDDPASATATTATRQRVGEAVDRSRQAIRSAMEEIDDQSISGAAALRDFDEAFTRRTLTADGQPHPIRISEDGRPLHYVGPDGQPLRDPNGRTIIPQSLEGFEDAVERSTPVSDLRALKEARSDLLKRIKNLWQSDGALASRLQSAVRTLDDTLRAHGNEVLDDAGKVIRPADDNIRNFWSINDNFAATMRSEDAFKAGGNFPISSSSFNKNREALDLLDRYEGNSINPHLNMTEPERRSFAQGVMSQISVMLTKLGRTHNPAKKFGDRQTRENIRRIFGKDLLDELDRQALRANLATRTAGADKNSATHRLGAQEREQNALLAIVSSLSPMGMAANAARALTKRQQMRMQDGMMNYLGNATTDQPHLYYSRLRELMDADAAMRAFNAEPVPRTVIEGPVRLAPFTSTAPIRGDERGD